MMSSYISSIRLLSNADVFGDWHHVADVIDGFTLW